VSRLYPTLWARILANCTVDPITGCWLWLGKTKHSRGTQARYPAMNLRVEGKHKTVAVYRVVASLILGRELDPSQETVEHTCFTTVCIAPHCIGLMTNIDNASSARARKLGRDHERPMTLLLQPDEGRFWHPDEPIPF